MIDLTPLDVRKKAGDFRKALRGYDSEEVDAFLQLAAERLEELVKENLTLRERSERLQEQVLGHEGRERAVQEALVVAQQMRADLRAQVERETDLRRRETEAELEGRRQEAAGAMDRTRRSLEELEKRRLRFLRAFRAMLQNELEALAIEEARVSSDAPEDPGGARLARTTEEREGRSARASVTPAQAVEALGSPPEADGEGGLWLSSILKEEGPKGGGDDKSRA
jgi:cell division initiation protein